MTINNEEKDAKHPAKRNLVWSPRIGEWVDPDTGCPVLKKPGDNVRIAEGADAPIFSVEGDER
jgi:hypothetical protein